MLTETQIQNLLAFLNRVEIKGFKEIQVMNEILHILQNMRGGVTHEGSGVNGQHSKDNS